MATIEFEHVSKFYGGSRIVRDLNLVIGDGEFVVLVGPSGCGKSTTLRMLAGLEDVSGGSIKIDGRVVNDLEARERDIAMVFQSYALYPHLSVFDNMAFALQLRKLPETEIRARVEKVAATLDIAHLLGRKPKALSGGQRQRVAMGRAIVREPKVFLFDEPLSNLDAQLRTRMRVEIKKLMRKLGGTAVYVTHDQTEAMTMADRIVVLDKGEVMQTGTPVELYERPASAFVGQFIGSPVMNLLEAEFSAGRLKLCTGAEFALAGASLPGKLLVGIRPHDLSLGDEGPLTMAGTVYGAEISGGATCLELQYGERLLLAQVAGHHPLEDKPVTLFLRREALHFFDAHTGARL